MNKQDELKASELSKCGTLRCSHICEWCSIHGYHNGLLEMAAWKEEQMIEKVYQLLVEKYFFTEDEAKDFKQAMKEE